MKNSNKSVRKIIKHTAKKLVKPIVRTNMEEVRRENIVLSSETFSEKELNLLNKGLNYASRLNVEKDYLLFIQESESKNS